MDDKTLSHGSDGKPQVLRESEFYGGCIRVKISVKNTSSLVITAVALELESDEKILHFDRCEPEYPQKNGKIILDTINPHTDRTIAFYLDPLICAKEGTDINCRVNFKYADGKPDTVNMEPLKIQVVCPIFRTEHDINIGRLKELIKELHSHDSKVYTIPKRVDIAESLKTCRNVIQQHDVRHIKTFKTTDDSTYECWYFGKTKVTKKDLVIKCAVRRDTNSIEIFVSGDDPRDITGLLAEIGRNLTKEFDTLGKVQPVFNVVVKNSMVKGSNLLSFCDLDGICGGNVVIEDSFVDGTNVASWNEAAQKEREDKARRGREEVSRVLFKQTSTGTENYVQIGEFSFDRKYIRKKQNDISDFENESGYSVAFGGEKWTKGKAMEYIEIPYGFIGISKTGVERGISKKLKDAVKKDITASSYAELQSSVKIAKKEDKVVQNVAIKAEKEKTEQEEEIRRKQEEKERIAKEREKLSVSEKKEGISQIKLLAVALLLGVLLIGYWVLAPGATETPVTMKSTPTPTPEATTSVIQTPTVTQTVSPALVSTPAQKTFTNSIGMEFVVIPAGEFDMGIPSDSNFIWEQPKQHVKIAKAFYMGKYEVTQKQWREVMGNIPSSFKGDNLPVETVSWNDVQEFIKKLNEKEGSNKYRLPSEAEWEYAARAGTNTRYSFGDDESKLGDYAWYDTKNSDSKTHEVGQKKPNQWGLYDMHGNVDELVQDIWHDNYNGAPTDGSAWESGSGSSRVARGGGWNGNARNIRSASRGYVVTAGGVSSTLGFRLVMEITTNVSLSTNITPVVSTIPIITPSTDQKTFANSIGMEFVLIPAGEFDMGSLSNEAGRYEQEGPVHHVNISKAFYIGKYEVTQKQWRDVMGSSPSSFKGDNLPVEQVTWDDVQDFIKKLNEKDGGNKYRLPTEAEWEYVARAGTTTRYSFGDDESKLGDYAWYDSNSGNKTHEVGQKKPNPWGLYDMHGNVNEWVLDKLHGNYNGAPTDGSTWENQGYPIFVFRGGSWLFYAGDCRSAFRSGVVAAAKRGDFGFRLLEEV